MNENVLSIGKTIMQMNIHLCSSFNLIWFFKSLRICFALLQQLCAGLDFRSINECIFNSLNFERILQTASVEFLLFVTI